MCDLSDGELYKIVSPQSGITLLSTTLTNQLVRFAFSAAPGQSYVVESRAALQQGTWQPLTNVTAAVASTNLVVTDTVGSTQRFYRVRTP